MTGHGAPQLFALLRTHELREQFVAATAELGGTLKSKVQVGELSVVGPSGIHAENAQILLLDVDAENGAEMDVLNQLRLEAAVTHTPILVTSGQLSTTAMRRLLRDGVDDYVPQPFAKEDVVEALAMALRKLHRRRAAHTGQGRIFSFIKASGGMGATSLADNTASALSQLRRTQRASVCLIDLDLQFGAAALYLDVEKSAAMVEMARARTARREPLAR